MRSPKPAKEDPAVVAAREREERRAENARTEETQALLIGQTQRRLRRYGSVSGSGSIPIYGGAGQAGGSVSGSSTSSGGGRVFTGGGGGSGRDLAVLY